MPEFTPTKQRIFSRLIDGRPHPFAEMVHAMDPDIKDPYDEFRDSYSARLRNHIYEMKPGLSDRGLLVVVRLIRNRREWQMMRRLDSGE